MPPTESQCERSHLSVVDDFGASIQRRVLMQIKTLAATVTVVGLAAGLTAHVTAQRQRPAEVAYDITTPAGKVASVRGTSRSGSRR
jgi:hypothetical protein